jgi:hypothetical protein
MELQKVLPAAPGVLGSILEDPQYQTNAMRWMTQQAYEERGRPLRLIEPMEHARVQKLIDALANKNFEALRTSPKVIGLKITAAYSNGIQRPEFNLLEVAAVYDAEPLVRKAITRQLNLWFKQGFQFISEDQSLVDYIRKRFKTISYVSGIPTLDLFKQIVTSLLKYSNAFIIKVRDKNLSTGAIHDGRQPIAGYFVVSALNMFPKYNNGKLEKWVRFLSNGSRVQEFDPKDVIHLTIDREPDFLFGKPRMLGVIEDVAALRRIEENVEILISKFLFPVYQLSVGTPEMPCKYYNDGSSEIDLARQMVQNMEAEGMLVTSERFKLEIVGARSEALQIDSYLAHFKARVYAGLGVSAVDMGEGDTANRATADNISQNLKDLVVEDQLSFCAQIQQVMFGELFLEHPANISALNAFDQVKLRFANVDLDNLIKYESHVINLWNNDLMTQNEARQQIGRDVLTDDDRNETRFHLIDVPLAVIQARDEPFTSEAKKLAAANTKKALTATPLPAGGAAAPKVAPGKRATPGAAGPIRTKSPAKPVRPGQPPVQKGTPASRGPANITGPANQHGKNPGPAKAKSSFEAGLIGNRLADLTTSLLSAGTIDDMAEVISELFPDNREREIILPVVEEALKDCARRSNLRANLVSGFVLISDQFPDIAEETEENV